MRQLSERLRSFAETARGARQVLLIAVTLTMAAIAIQTQLAIGQDRALTLAAEREHGLTTVRLLGEHTRQIFNDAAGNIDTLARAIELARGDKPADDALIRTVLTRAQPFTRVLTSFQFVNTQGVASVSSIDYPAYQTDADDRTYIPQLLEQPALRTPVLGRPFARFYDGELILPLARNFTGGDDLYHGLLSTDISVSYFSDFYVPIARDSNAVVSLLSDDGFLIVRAPAPKDPSAGRPEATPPLTPLLTGPDEGVFEAGDLLDGERQTQRLYFHKKIEGYPVTALYSRRLDDVLAPWRIRSRDRVVFSLAIAATVVLLSLFLLLHIRRLDSSRQLLRRSEAKFADIFLHSPVPLALVRLADERLVEANAAFLTQFGYQAEEVIGRTPRELGIWDDIADRQPYIDRLTAERRLSGYEARLVGRDGRVMSCVVSAQVFDSDEGAIAIFSPVDETQQREAEARMRRLEQNLREAQKMEAIGTLAGGIAHDFNNILAAILGNVSMARQDVCDDQVVSGFLDEINTAALRARNLVQQILAFSRRQPHQMLAQPLRPIVEESARLLRATLPARVALDLDLSDEPLYVQADATQLQQVVLNLCTNGWHALSGSTGRLTLGCARAALDAASDPRLGRLPRGDYVHLWVADTGSGIAEELLDRVFEPFFTTKPVGQGTGLGLAVVHGIVAEHRGGITVDSRVGQGTTFHVYLPLVDPPSQCRAPEPVSMAADDAGQGHVLYLDDDEVMLLMVERLLKRHGYQARCLQSASQALAVLGDPAIPVDLLITDFNMPGLSGLEVVDEATRLRPGLPVLITSGYVSDELIAGARRVGARAVLQKQNTLEELPALVRQWLRH